MSTNHRPISTSLVHLQSRFLGILPKIERHARCYFRHVRCWSTKEDRIAETVALSWKWFRRLDEQGKDPTQFPTVLASYSARAVRNGRRLCGQERAKDSLSFLAQQRHSFVVTKLPDVSTQESNPLDTALVDNTRSLVPDAVAFRIDYPAWQRTLAPEKRRITNAMAVGHRTLDLAVRFKVSQGRISQLRQELRQSWREFISEVVIPTPSKSAA